MTDEEILTNVMKKAGEQYIGQLLSIVANNYTMLDVIEDELYYPIIFSKEFLQAFFGSEWKEGDCITQPLTEAFKETPPRWQYHAKELILSENRLEYLSQYL